MLNKEVIEGVCACCGRRADWIRNKQSFGFDPVKKSKVEEIIAEDLKWAEKADRNDEAVVRLFRALNFLNGNIPVVKG